MKETMHPNMSLMTKLDIQNLDACRDDFADDFIWHYFNSKLPDLHGDYSGVEGLKAFFAKLSEKSNSSFQVNLVEARPAGDELVVVQVCNRMTLDDQEGNRLDLVENAIEFDAVVIWWIVGNKFAEAWDIPVVNTVRPIQQS